MQVCVLSLRSGPLKVRCDEYDVFESRDRDILSCSGLVSGEIVDFESVTDLVGDNGGGGGPGIARKIDFC